MPNRPDAKAENVVRSTAEVSAEILGDRPMNAEPANGTRWIGRVIALMMPNRATILLSAAAPAASLSRLFRWVPLPAARNRAIGTP
jgi:hypothetical protein